MTSVAGTMDVSAALFTGPGQGLTQLSELGLAVVLCTAIGLEREVRHRSAGLRTHTLVGLGAALFMLVSKYGFFDVLGDNVKLDPSRVAAQIVTGIGFIGGGVIFVRRDIVKGLTTAAIVWLTAAIGMACGAGLGLLAVAGTVGHFAVVHLYPYLARRVPGARTAEARLRVVYRDGTGALRLALVACTSRGFVVDDVSIDKGVDERGPEPGAVAVTLRVRGSGSIVELGAAIAEVTGVISVDAGGEEASE